jgi:hypothetical protein
MPARGYPQPAGRLFYARMPSTWHPVKSVVCPLFVCFLSLFCAFGLSPKNRGYGRRVRKNNAMIQTKNCDTKPVPKPGSFYEPRIISSLTKQLIDWRDNGEHELVLYNVVDPRLQTKIHQAAASKAVGIKVKTRMDPKQNIIRVYRVE